MGANHDRMVRAEIRSNRQPRPPKVFGKPNIHVLENAMEAIQQQLDLVEWNADTLDNIADIMRAAGYEIRDTDVQEGQ